MVAECSKAASKVLPVIFVTYRSLLKGRTLTASAARIEPSERFSIELRIPEKKQEGVDCFSKSYIYTLLINEREIGDFFYDMV